VLIDGDGLNILFSIRDARSTNVDELRGEKELWWNLFHVSFAELEKNEISFHVGLHFGILSPKKRQIWVIWNTGFFGALLILCHIGYASVLAYSATQIVLAQLASLRRLSVLGKPLYQHYTRYTSRN